MEGSRRMGRCAPFGVLLLSFCVVGGQVVFVQPSGLFVAHLVAFLGWLLGFNSPALHQPPTEVTPDGGKVFGVSSVCP